MGGVLLVGMSSLVDLGVRFLVVLVRRLWLPVDRRLNSGLLAYYLGGDFVSLRVAWLPIFVV